MFWSDKNLLYNSPAIFASVDFKPIGLMYFNHMGSAAIIHTDSGNLTVFESALYTTNFGPLITTAH